jgi:hypothetical protein
VALPTFLIATPTIKLRRVIQLVKKRRRCKVHSAVNSLVEHPAQQSLTERTTQVVNYMHIGW